MESFFSFSSQNFAYLPISQEISSPIQFWLYLISDILSILCSLLVLHFILSDRTLRQALNNHVIILLLIIGLINELAGIPWMLYYLRSGVPHTETPLSYLFYFFFEYAIYTTQVILFAWATIERHILIFHSKWVATRKKRFFIHYLPIVAILLYCLIYYSVITFGSFCEHSFDAFIHGGIFTPCLYSTTILGIWDLVLHQMIPTVIIVIFSLTLIARILRQKCKINQPIHWRKHRKMATQLLLISALYLIFNSPWTVLIFMLRYGFLDDDTKLPVMYCVGLRTYVIFLFPFICYGALPELRSKFKQTFLCRRESQLLVHPIPLRVLPKFNGPAVRAEH